MLNLLLALLILLPQFVSGDYRDNLLLQAKVYIHRPEVFADQPFGMLPADPLIPIPDGWYLRVPAPTLKLYGIEAFKEWIDKRGIPGLDFSGEKDIFSQDMERLFRQDLTRDIQLKQAKPNYRFKLLKLAGTHVDDRMMTTVMHLQDLEVLQLNNQISDEGLVWLGKMFALKELSLANAPVTDKGLLSLQDLPRLQRLDLRGTRVSDKGIKALTKLPLIELQLGPGVSDTGVAAAASISTLQQMDLSQTQASEKGFKAIASHKLKLHTLFLGPKTTDKGVEAVAHITTLQRLDLTGTRMTDTGARVLYHLPYLEELALSQTAVGDAAIEALLPLKHLRFLELSDTLVTEAGLNRLAAIPSLQVISFSSSKEVDPTRLSAWRALPKLHTVIINGRPMSREWLEKAKAAHSWLYTPWVGVAEAAEDPPMEVAQLQDKPRAGLRMIHEVESDLNNIIPAPTMINIDNQQDSEKNFLGEFTVESGKPAKSKPKTPPSHP